jgi:subtilisin family serine protease
VHGDYVDELGHGTAVTAAIREKAPDAEIIAIKVFERALKTDIATLVRGIDEAAARAADVINLSLGTSKSEHRSLLENAVARARTQGALIVSANDDGGVRWLPGCLDDVVAVRADWSCERGAYAIAFVEDRLMLSTSAYPRDIPGVPRERNLNGVSFAVANASGFVARALEAARRSPAPHAAAITRVFTALEQGAGLQRSPVV